MQKNCFDYPVEFVDDLFGESTVLADALKRITGSSEPRVQIVADLNVVHHFKGLGQQIGRYVQRCGICLAGKPVVVAGGERIKNDSMQSTMRMHSALLSARLHHNDVVMAIGGGTIIDLAGYAAAQVRGGVNVVRIPTTPAAMMDAAFADYAAIDYSSVKDAIQVRSVPAAVFIDTAFASSVLDGVWRCGIGEAVRQAVAQDEKLFRRIVELCPAYVARDPKALEEIVKAVVALRAKKGKTDLGLWSAMRLEAMSKFRMPHGYGIIVGICLELAYAVECGYLSAEDRDTIIRLIGDSGALDAMRYVLPFLNQVDDLAKGFKAWELMSSSPAITVATGIGSSRTDEIPDVEAFKRSLKGFLAIQPVAEQSAATPDTPSDDVQPPPEE